MRGPTNKLIGLVLSFPRAGGQEPMPDTRRRCAAVWFLPAGTWERDTEHRRPGRPYGP